jgi:hypothetical protein
MHERIAHRNANAGLRTVRAEAGGAREILERAVAVALCV